VRLRLGRGVLPLRDFDASCPSTGEDKELVQRLSKDRVKTTCLLRSFSGSVVRASWKAWCNSRPSGRRESYRSSATGPDPQQVRMSECKFLNIKATSRCHPDFRLVPVESGLIFRFVPTTSGRSRRSKVGSCKIDAKRHFMEENRIGCVFPRLAQSQSRQSHLESSSGLSG